jgi:hypothetical protein
VEASGDEEHAGAVVVAVAEAAGDAAVEFDEAVDGFGAAVAGAAGVEVGQEGYLHCRNVLPRRLISGIGQDGNAAMIFSARASGGRGGCVVDGSDLLGAQPGEGDLVVPLVGGQARSRRARCRSVRCSAPARSRLRIPYIGSPLRPRCPWISCWTRRRTLVQRLGREGDDVEGAR